MMRMPILLFTALALLLASCPSGTEGLPEEEESSSSSGGNGNGPVTQTPTPGAPVIPAPALKDIRVTYGEEAITAVFTFDMAVTLTKPPELGGHVLEGNALTVTLPSSLALGPYPISFTAANPRSDSRRLTVSEAICVVRDSFSRSVPAAWGVAYSDRHGAVGLVDELPSPQKVVLY